MKKLRIIAAIIVLPLLLTLMVDGATGQRKKKRRGHIKKVQTVSIGQWGGWHVAMDVTAGGAKLEFDCAHAIINQPLKLDSRGRFEVKGFYAAEHGGPVRADEDQSGQPAHFKGRLEGQALTLTVTLDNSSTSAGPYTLEHGRRPRVTKCL